MIPEKTQHLCVLAAIIVITALAFSPVLNNGWVGYDDQPLVLNNYSITRLDTEHIHLIFTSVVNNAYIPLTSLSFALEYHWVKLKPFLYHLDNLFLYLLDIILVFFCARRLGLSLAAATIGTLFFSLHPLHVESVAWISERKDVLYALFYLAAVYSYLGFIQRRKYGQYILTIVFGTLSMLAKPMAISLPLVLFLFDWFYRRPFSLVLVLEKIPYLFIMGLLAGPTFSANGQASNAFTLLTFKGILQFIWCFIFYIKKFLVPIDLIPVYLLPQPVALFNQEYLGSMAALVLVVWSLIWFRKNRWYVWAWGFYFSSIFLLLRFDDHAYGNPVADRYMFLGELGFCLFIGVLADQWHKKISKNKMVLVMAISVILAFFAYRTYQQCKVWQSGVTLWGHELDILQKNKSIPWEDTLKTYHNLAVIYCDLGAGYQNRGDMRQAISAYDKAIAINSNLAEAYNNRGIIYQAMGNGARAILDYNKAIEINPASDQIYYDRGLAYQGQGNLRQSILDYSKAIGINPDFAGAYDKRGDVYIYQNNFNQALLDYDRALHINPMDGEAYYGRAYIFYEQRKYAASWENVHKAEATGYKIDPNFLEVLRKSSI